MLSIGFFVQSVDARERSEKAKAWFKYMNPCPSNGNNHGACPGYVIDHITALACGGNDAPSNMQWQTVKAGRLRTNGSVKVAKLVVWVIIRILVATQGHHLANIIRGKGADALPTPIAEISVMLLILIVDNNSSDLPVIEPATEPLPTT